MKTGKEIYMAGSRKKGSEIKRLGYCIRVSEDNELRYCINAAVRSLTNKSVKFIRGKIKVGSQGIYGYNYRITTENRT